MRLQLVFAITLMVMTVISFTNALHGMGHLKTWKSYFDTHQFQPEAFERAGFAIPKDQWFTQQLDHFNNQDTRTWQQRYLVNDTYWNPDLNGPVFLQIGGEGAISAGYVLTMEMVQYAQTHGALVIALEHRFYGKSQPLPSLSTDNLQYLSSEQALADVANFINTFKQQYPNSQFITFGCSYPGALAAWFRIKYPHLTSGSVASSGPVQATLDFYQYLDVVDQSLTAFTGASCDARIQNATNQIQSMLKSQSGQAQLQADFKTCSPLNNNDDISQFMSALMGNWMGTVQYNDEGGNPIDINVLCRIMNNKTLSAYQAYADISNMFVRLSGQKCLDISYQEMIELLSNTTATPNGVGIRQWTYQTCTEFGYFQTTDSDGQPFGNLVPLEMSLKMCTDVFGSVGANPGARINDTNTMYGGNKPYGSTKILFVNGSIDPWHALSVTSDFNRSVKAILIQGTAHCADADPAGPKSPASLPQAQQAINKQISLWLTEGNH